MSDDEHGEEPAEGEEDNYSLGESAELTADQKEALQTTMDSIRQALAPRIKIQPPKLSLPQSALKNIAAISRIVETQQAMVASAIKPILDAQSLRQKQFINITSDIFKSHALVQSNLNLIASQLTWNVDFGIAASAAKAAKGFAEQQATWLKGIAPAIAAIRAAFYPPNLRSIEALKFEEVEQVVMVDGIALYGLPRASIAEALIRADGTSRRREILGRRWTSISADCRTAAEGCKSKAAAPYVPFALAALNALDAGHTEAAQALAGSLIDAILSSYFGKERTKYTPDRRGKRTKDAYDEFNFRQFIAFAPIWQTYQQFFITDGDKVPTAFSRNATAHTVHPRQFSRRNSVQALMIACSLIYRLEEESAQAVTESNHALVGKRASGATKTDRRDGID